MYRVDYGDGMVLAVRNVSEEDRTVRVASKTGTLSEWDPVAATCRDCSGAAQRSIEPHGMRCFAVTDSPVGTTAPPDDGRRIAIDVAMVIILPTAGSGLRLMEEVCGNQTCLPLLLLRFQILWLTTQRLIPLIRLVLLIFLPIRQLPGNGKRIRLLSVTWMEPTSIRRTQR